MDEILGTLISSIVPVLGFVATGLVSWASVEATKYVRMRTKSKAANEAMEHICHSVKTVVADLNQTMIPVIRAAAADGQISRSEGTKIKKLAFVKISNQIPERIQNSARFFVESIPSLISSKIEKTVGELKIKGKDDT